MTNLASAEPIQSDPSGLSFSEALILLKQGFVVSRSGWNGKDMFLYLVPGSEFVASREPLVSIFGEGTTVRYHGHIDMRTAQGYVVPWLASQADLLADDWRAVPIAGRASPAAPAG